MTKNPSVDLIKGVLILFVMAGHAMELTHQAHLAMWVGAGFRMPLMIGISGYLLNVIRTRHDPPERIFGRYANRILLPWMVALLIYILVSGWTVSWTLPIELLLRPPFHLWYIPVLFFLILVTRLVPFSPLQLLAVGTPISLAIMYSFGLGHGAIGDSLLSPDNRFLRFPVYFFFGMLVAERGLPSRYLGVVLLTGALGMIWWSTLQGSDNDLAFVPARLLMCLGLIALLPRLSALRLSFAPLNALGRDSLFFYLWHPLVMAVLMMAGADTLPMFVLSLVLLAVASKSTARHALVQRFVGSRAAMRSASAPIGPDTVPARAA